MAEGNVTSDAAPPRVVPCAPPGASSVIDWRLAVALCGVMMLSGCDPRGAGPVAADDVTFEDERLVDLTGDGQIERVAVNASGPAYDSLQIQLDVLTQRDSLLFREVWWSARYLEYRTGPQPADTTVQRIVRGHLTELLRDTAFAPPAIRDGEPQPGGVRPDPAAVRYDIAEHSWRRSAGVPDTVPLPAGAHDEIVELTLPEEEVAAVVGELARQPSFTFFLGGEAAHTIAWSWLERRFIRIRACC
jgi:hypothetical protein